MTPIEVPPRSLAETIEFLAKLSAEASPGPWYVREMDDNSCCSAVDVSTTAEDYSGQDVFARSEWDEKSIVAGCLIQSSLRAVHADGLWFENAMLIAEMRNCLPELLRLARLGLSRTDPGLAEA